MPKQIRLQVALLGALLGCSASLAADDPVSDIQSLTTQWTSLEHQQDLLRSNWRRDKPVLEQQLSLLQRESRELNDFLEQSQQEQGEVEQRRLELLEQQTQLEQEQAALERSLKQAAIRLKALQARLPPPLSEAWAEALPRLDDPAQTSSERLQQILDLLGQLDDFEQKVTLNETVMTLADGQEYLVKQIYLGLSHGWYVTADQQHAAAGTAGQDGWQWTPVGDGAPIARIVAILERRANPELVSVPLQLNGSSAEGN
jgi:DNA repair exonuclease SbcCD ATPase subunit